MATIDVVKRETELGVSGTWTGLATGDNGSALSVAGNKASVSVEGTFLAATVTMQGSNDGTNWYSLVDEVSPTTACSFTSAGIKGVLPLSKYVRPVVTGGAGSALNINYVGFRN